MFSFNSPYGACEACGGLGTTLRFDPELIVPDDRLAKAVYEVGYELDNRPDWVQVPLRGILELMESRT